MNIKKILVWASVLTLFGSIVAVFCVQACSQSAASPTESQPVEASQVQAEVTEQMLVDYMNILPDMDDSTAQVSISELLSRAEEKQDKFLFLTELLEKYLYNPNSPIRNEEYYLYALQYLETSPALSEAQKSRFAYQLQSVLKNRKGTKATDFVYTLTNGKHERMHGIVSDFLLLYFNNPGCRACEEMQVALESSTTVSLAIQQNRLKVLAVYPDEDLAAWKANQQHIPAMWINGYDTSKAILEKELYNLRAIPSLYLLDKNKIVLVKDGTVGQIEALLEKIK